MGLNKTLLFLATVAALAGQAGAQTNPEGTGGESGLPDVDGDGVYPPNDACPETFGVSSNNGCPEGEELVMVTGLRQNKVVCPDGSVASDASNCPGYIIWNSSIATVNYSQRTRQVDQVANAPPCGEEVDAACRCATAKVKVYDENANNFDCYDRPPDEGCPWDQTFDFDLKVWACVTTPLDKNPKKMAERVKNCGAPTVKKYWDHPKIVAINYGFSSGAPSRYGTTGCHPDRDEPPELVDEPPEAISVTYFRSAIEGSGGAYSSYWHWGALAVIHENIHVDDFIRYNSCAPWLTSEGQAGMRRAGYTERDFNEEGFNEWTRVRSHDEYDDTFGVRAPEDPDHVAAVDNKPLSCLFDR